MSEPPNNPPSTPLSTPESMLLEMPTVRKRFIVKGYVQLVGYRVLVKMVANRLGIVGFAHNLPDQSVEVVCEGASEAIERFIKQIDRKGNPASTLDIDVASIEEAPPVPTGQLKTFEIDYGRKLTVVEKDKTDRDERMILGASDLTMMMGGVGKAVEVVGQKVDGLGAKMDCVGQKVDGVGKAVEIVGQKVDGVGQKVDAMHSDMNKRFDHMADRYDMIAASLKEAIVHMDHNAEKTDRAIEKSRRETILAVRKSQDETAKLLTRSRMETIIAVRKISKDTATELSRSRKEVAASNHELAGAVKFMMAKMSGKPANPARSRTKTRKARK